MTSWNWWKLIYNQCHSNSDLTSNWRAFGTDGVNFRECTAPRGFGSYTKTARVLVRQRASRSDFIPNIINQLIVII
jgi:hypothetical protein